MKNAEQPAFPIENFNTYNGLTKREYIATQIMAAVISRGESISNYPDLFTNETRVVLLAADALLKALEEK
jgi:hypothetical protein